jgi:hypothetical protein
VTNVVKGSSNHGHDWMSRHVHCISVARKKREWCVCLGKHRRAKFAPRAADRKFDHDSSASAIGTFHDNVKVAVVFHFNAHNAAGYGVPVSLCRNSRRRSCDFDFGSSPGIYVGRRYFSDSQREEHMPYVTHVYVSR